MPEDVCRWQQENEEDSGAWFTDCGNAFWLNEGTPEENGMKYCTYCGKRLAGIPYQPDG